MRKNKRFQEQILLLVRGATLLGRIDAPRSASDNGPVPRMGRVHAGPDQTSPISQIRSIASQARRSKRLFATLPAIARMVTCRDRTMTRAPRADDRVGKQRSAFTRCDCSPVVNHRPRWTSPALPYHFAFILCGLCLPIGRRHPGAFPRNPRCAQSC